MCTDTKSNLESIEDFVLNQDKIVTYRWLSQKLKIHANTSKQLLYSYTLKNTDDNLLVTFLVSGTTQDDGVKVYIVNQSQVDKVKSSLDKVISEHVYSIQKLSSSVSSSDIYLADSSVENSCCKLGSISPRVVEHREFKVVVPEKPAASSKSVLPSSKPQEKIKPSEVQDKSKTVSPTKVNRKSNDLNALFSKQNAANAEKRNTENPSHKDEAVKQKTSHENETKSKVLSPTKNHKKSKEGKINTLFSKQIALNAGKKKNENSLKEAERENVNRLIEDDPTDGDGKDDNSENSLQPEKTVLKTPIGKQKKSSKSRSSKRKSKQQDNTPARKRKRIVLASDSESDEDEEEEMDLEEEPEPEPQVQAEVPDSDDEVIPPTPFCDKAKRRIRKQIDKTYTDEEGFVVTKKEFVYESCSDEEIDGETSKGDISSTPSKKPNKDEDKASEKLEQSNKGDEIKETLEHSIEGDENKEKLKQSNKGDENKEVEAKANNSKKSKDNKKSEKKPAKGKVKSPKKVAQKSNRNQSSITSFFTKK